MVEELRKGRREWTWPGKKSRRVKGKSFEGEKGNGDRARKKKMEKSSVTSTGYSLYIEEYFHILLLDHHESQVLNLLL